MAIAVYVNATILRYRLKKDATSFKNMGRVGPVLVKPGLGLGRFSIKGESFRPRVVSTLGRFGPISIGRIRK